MRGDLSETPAADLCRRLAGASATGTLDVEGPDGRGTLVFRDGHVVGARSPAPAARIGDRLVGAGVLAEETLAEVLRTQARDGAHRRLGALLVERGLVDRDVVTDVVRDQVTDAVFEVVGWTYGAFRFGPDDVDGEDAEVPLALRVEPLLAEVARRREAWQVVARLVPDRDAIPSSTAEAPSEPATLTPDERAVLAAVDGRRTVHELAVDLGYGEFELARVVHALAVRGAVEVRGPEDEIGRALDDALAALAASPVEPEPSPVEPSPVEVASAPLASEPTAEADAPVTPTSGGTRDVSELLRELSRLSGDEPPPRDVPPPRRTSPPAATPDPRDGAGGKRRRRFGRG